MRATRQLWQEIREAYARRLASRGVCLSVERAWARTSDGRWLVLPAATDHPRPGAWWLGFDEQEMARRAAVGAILLCRSAGGAVADFGLPADLLREIAPDLALKGGTNQRQFTVVQRGDRYVLMMKGGRELDITGRRGDLSWLSPSVQPMAMTAREPEPAYGVPAECLGPMPDPSPPDLAAERRFFARCRDGKLEPIDPADPRGRREQYLGVPPPGPGPPPCG